MCGTCAPARGCVTKINCIQTTVVIIDQPNPFDCILTMYMLYRTYGRTLVLGGEVPLSSLAGGEGVRFGVLFAVGVEMVMPGDDTPLVINMGADIPLEVNQRFTLREGQMTIGTGVVTEILD